MVLKCITLLGCLVITTASAINVSPSDGLLSHWSAFKGQHGKQYASAAEEAKRFEIFASNKLEIDRFNAEESEKAGYRQGLNQFSDTTSEEIHGSRHRMQRMTASRSNHVDHEYLERLLRDDGKPLPAEVDWRKEGRVSYVRTQDGCLTSYASAPVGVLEGQQKVVKSMGKLVELSVQQILDCGRTGCVDDSLDYGFNTTVWLQGLVSDKEYPYRATRGPECKIDPYNIVIRPKNFTIIEPQNNEHNLQKVVAKYGPVAAQVDAWQSSFVHYLQGVYSDDDCNQSVSHSVLVVGYGTDPKEGNYWIIKLDWGKHWGEDGYMRLKRGVNMCRIAYQPMIFTF